MIVLYTAMDGRDAIAVPEFKHIILPENRRYIYAVTRSLRHPNLFTKRDLNDLVITRVDFDDFPDPVKALIVLYEM